ncbi:MAG: thiamine-phosphate kinase [Candidatus Deferrimicrobiaceae bacterium]
MRKRRKSVGEIGEFSLIDRIGKILPATRAKDLLIGIGDDTAVIRMDKRRALLVTCDIQVEGRHFRFDRITPYQLGRRAMAVNVSDIASMGGKPTFALVSLGLPGAFPVASYDRLFEGMRDELRRYGARIVGGNLARTEDVLVVDITLMGENDLSRVMTRGGARVGDRVFVTGRLGASGAGFQALKAFGKKVPARYRHLVACHLVPTPRVTLGRRISRAGVATAMIDLSDGLAGDLFHICTRSRVGAEIYPDRLPLPERIGEIAARSGKSVIDLALHSGEDYELLFTAPPGVPARKIRSLSRDSGIPITEIGKIVGRKEGYCLVDSQGIRTPLTPAGWDHFRTPGRSRKETKR